MNLFYLTVLSAVLIIFIVLPFVLFMKFVFSKKNENDLTGQELTELEETVGKLISKLEEKSREAEKLLSSKIAEIEKIIEKADKITKMVEPNHIETRRREEDNQAEDKNKIIEMARRGMKPEIIAKEVKMRTGEVQLILGLGKINKLKNKFQGIVNDKIDHIAN